MTENRSAATWGVRGWGGAHLKIFYHNPQMDSAIQQLYNTTTVHSLSYSPLEALYHTL